MGHFLLQCKQPFFLRTKRCNLTRGHENKRERNAKHKPVPVDGLEMPQSLGEIYFFNGGAEWTGRLLGLFWLSSVDTKMKRKSKESSEFQTDGVILSLPLSGIKVMHLTFCQDWSVSEKESVF